MRWTSPAPPLAQLTPQVRANIAERGAEAVRKLEQLKSELGGLITKVQGTGLLFSCELAPQFKCYGANSTEEWLRQHGINVIHGGENSLRFTPHFGMDSQELDLLVAMVGRALREARARAGRGGVSHRFGRTGGSGRSRCQRRWRRPEG